MDENKYNIFTDCCNKICGIRIRVVRGFGELLLCLCSDLEKWPFLFLFLFLFIGLSASQSQESNRTQHSPLGFDICYYFLRQARCQFFIITEVMINLSTFGIILFSFFFWSNNILSSFNFQGFSKKKKVSTFNIWYTCF